MEDIMQKILPHKNVLPKDPYSYPQMSGVPLSLTDCHVFLHYHKM